MNTIALSLDDARRLAVTAQLLAAPRPRSLADVLRHLGQIQIDPTRAVERTERLVFWSRLGTYDIAALDRALFEEREFFEYWVHILPRHDFMLHRETMLRYPRGESARSRYMREWLQANAKFRRYVLDSLRRSAPLRSRDLEDRATLPWRSGGWNDGKNLGRMLDALWFAGEIATVGREGTERLWDLAERVYPVDEPRLPERDVAGRILHRQLANRGVARLIDFGFAFDGRPPAYDEALADLLEAGLAAPATVEGLPGRWYVDPHVLEARFRPRTTLLSPFDLLVANRKRTEELFDFRYRLEIYLPREKRQFGYYVLPILHGHTLIGRIDPLYDRESRRLLINAVHAEVGAPDDAGEAVGEAIAELGAWLGAEEIRFAEVLPRAWRQALEARQRAPLADVGRAEVRASRRLTAKVGESPDSRLDVTAPGVDKW